MELEPFVDDIRRQVTATAALAGPEAAAAADRLVAAVDAAVRLALIGALGAAAEELTRELAPGAVEVRLRGGDPEFVVTAPPEAVAADGSPDAAVGAAFDDGDDGTARITLRLPQSLKSAAEAAAAGERASVNTWLERAVAGALTPGAGRSRRGAGRVGQTLQGWAR